MSIMNIAGTQPVDDPEYRYKMPRLMAKIEGRGNGIKTLVVNCADIALSLHRSTGEVCKFFGCELGAQSKYDEKTDRAIVNGAFDAGTMQNHLSKYIELFVLCPSCRLPETKYKFKGQMIYHKCYACGAVEAVDMNHKLTTFILKEHTAMKRSSKKGGDKDDKKKKKKERKDKEKSHSNGDEPENEEVSPEKKKKEKKEKKEKGEKGEKKEHKKKKHKDHKREEPVEDEVEWHTDLSPEAVAARAAEAAAIEAAAQAAMEQAAAGSDDDVVATLDNLEVDDENAISSGVSNLQTYLKDAHTESEIFEEVCRLQTYTALPIADRLVIFFRAAFDGSILSSNQVAKYAPVLEKLVQGTHAQLQLIALVEHFCAVEHPDLINSFPIVLKLLYDEDLLDEENLVKWADEETRKLHAHWEISDDQAGTLKSLLQPFIEWLKNAEEESEDEGDEDED